MIFNKLPKLETIKTPENNIKEGVDFVFKQNPELALIGTKEEYSRYLDTIFPESKIKEIVYHGGKKDLPEFDVDRLDVKPTTGLKKESVGAYFTGSLSLAKEFQRQAQISLSLDKGFSIYLKSIFGNKSLSNTYAVLLNSKNPYIINASFQNRNNELKINSGNITKEERDLLLSKGYDSVVRKKEEFVALIKEQIYILGSNLDIRRFKNFVSENNKDR